MHKAETTLSNNTIQGTGQDFLKAAIVRCCSGVSNPDKEVIRSMSGIPRKHRLILKDYARRLNTYRREFRRAGLSFLMQVHDEGIWEVDAKAAHEVGVKVAEVMTWRHYFPPFPVKRDYAVPLIVEGGYAQNWAEAKKTKITVGYEEWERYQ